jgi:hypothetical protein
MDAMTFFLLLLALAVLVSVVATVRMVRSDGYGSTPVPGSHHAWDEADLLR